MYGETKPDKISMLIDFKFNFKKEFSQTASIGGSYICRI